MLVFIRNLCLVCVLSAMSTTVLAQTESDVIDVVFMDGYSLEVRDWTFKYRFGEADREPSAVHSYSPSFKYTKDLLVDMNKTARGISVSRTIGGDKISSIKTIWAEGGYSTGYQITLRNGEMFRTSQSPPHHLLSSAKVVFDPMLFVQGKTKDGDFEMRLDRFYSGGAASEKIDEIRFRLKGAGSQ